ncbi:MAG: hypothetical protein PHH77_07770 [Victivallaceae bacterium]|nr:hypothetical protein [Victivallaceae bacterium]
MRKMFSLVVLAMLIALLAAGCKTTATVCEFDQDGKITKKTVTEADAIDKITKSTKNKTIVAWSDGWAAYISASTATTEDPTPTGKIFAGKVARGYISLLKDQQNFGDVAKVIQATKSDLSVSTSGVTSTSSNAVETSSNTTATNSETASATSSSITDSGTTTDSSATVTADTVATAKETAEGI